MSDETRHVSALNARVLVNHSISTPDGLAFDWVHNNLYWTDTGEDAISVINVDTLHRTELITGLPDEPRAIVVDPRENHGYV